MITDDKVLIDLLLDEENGIASTLTMLNHNLKVEWAAVNRSRTSHHFVDFSEYNRIRNRMIDYLFKLNKKHHFMDYVTLRRYPYFLSSIDTILLGLFIANTVFDQSND